MEYTSARIHRLDLPTRRPFVTADGSVSVRQVGLVEIERDGFVGWGEAAPYPGQDEPIDQVLAAATGHGVSRTLGAAIDQALTDSLARRDGRSLAIGAPDRIPISVAVGLDDPGGVVGSLVDRGITHFKVKVAPGHVRHVVHLRADHPDVVLGLDANRSFDAETVAALYDLAEVGVAYIEEPVRHRDREIASRLRSSLEAPIFVDESITSWTDLRAAVADPTVDGVTIKPGRLGWSRALAAAEAAEVAGKLWRASGLLETGVGRAFTDSLAQRSAAISDVAPAELFLAEDPAPSRWLDDGTVRVPSGPGIGVDPDPDVLERYAVEVVDIEIPLSRPGDPVIG